MKVKKFKQWILNRLVNSRQTSFFEKANFKIMFLLKDRLFREDNDLVKYNLNGREIILPFSHDLPVSKSLLPVYSENIGRIALYAKQKYDQLKIIDIGANIGDTVFIIKANVDTPMLCIEGESKYFSLLQFNTSYWDDVYLEKSFIGDKTSENAEIISSRGTGRIVEIQNPSKTLSFESLSAVIERNPIFSDFKLIKIDTDGFDCRIIRNEMSLFARVKPIIFFEYDPYSLRNINDDGLSVFQILREGGYEKLIIYESNGDYLLMTDLYHTQILEDIHHFYSGRKSQKYCDICVFHTEDNELAESVRLRELSFFSKQRQFDLPQLKTRERESK